MGKEESLFDKSAAKARGLISTGYHLPYNPKLTERAIELRKNLTEAEKHLWFGYLRNFKYPVLRQRPIDNYIVDFYCPKLKLVIEIDGDTHYTNEGKTYDDRRTQILGFYGLSVVRFTNLDVMGSLDGVCHEIDRLILPRPHC